MSSSTMPIVILSSAGTEAGPPRPTSIWRDDLCVVLHNAYRHPFLGRHRGRPSTADIRLEGQPLCRPRLMFTQRKRPAHFPPLEYSNRSVIIFLTVCTHNRRPILANPTVYEHLRQAWEAADEWSVGRYVLMPDHIHMFCSPASWPMRSLASWLRFWKSRAAAAWPCAIEPPVWQRDAWDTQLRAGDSYGEKWEYVRQNPVRAGLTQAPEDWPFQGELNILRWHNP